MKTTMALALLVLVVSGAPKPKGAPEVISREIVFIDYMDSTRIGGADMMFSFARDAKIADIHGNIIKNIKDIPIPCDAFIELNDKGEITFLRVVKIYKKIKVSPFLGSENTAYTDLKAVDSIPIKSIEELKKIKAAPIGGIGVVKDTMVKIKPLPRK